MNRVELTTVTPAKTPTPIARHGNAVVRCATVAVLLATTAAPVGALARPGAAADVGRCVLSASPQPHLPPAATTMRHTTATRLSYPQPAGTALRRLATRLTFSPCDHVPGTYDLVHHRRRDIPPKYGIAVRDVVRWRADDGSGAQLLTTHPPGLAAPAKEWWLPGRWPPELSFSRPFTHIDLLHAELGLTGTPPTNAREVLRHLRYLLTWHSPRRDARSATLTVLASIDGLAYHPHVSDEAGRRGIGITTTGDKWRELLVLHPQTAEVLAYESAIRTRSGWQPQVYVLYLTHSHTSGRWWEPAHPPSSHPTAARRLYPRLQQHQLPTFTAPCHTTM